MNKKAVLAEFDKFTREEKVKYILENKELFQITRNTISGGLEVKLIIDNIAVINLKLNYNDLAKYLNIYLEL
jgi:hypothetical protein